MAWRYLMDVKGVHCSRRILRTWLPLYVNPLLQSRFRLENEFSRFFSQPTVLWESSQIFMMQNILCDWHMTGRKTSFLHILGHSIKNLTGAVPGWYGSFEFDHNLPVFPALCSYCFRPIIYNRLVVFTLLLVWIHLFEISVSPQLMDILYQQQVQTPWNLSFIYSFNVKSWCRNLEIDVFNTPLFCESMFTPTYSDNVRVLLIKCGRWSAQSHWKMPLLPSFMSHRASQRHISRSTFETFHKVRLRLNLDLPILMPFLETLKVFELTDENWIPPHFSREFLTPR